MQGVECVGPKPLFQLLIKDLVTGDGGGWGVTGDRKPTMSVMNWWLL